MPKPSALAKSKDFADLEGQMTGRIQSMVDWYERKAKRFITLTFWEREAKAPSKRSKGIRPRLNHRRPDKAMWDDPPDIELAFRHRDRVNALELKLAKLEELLDSKTLEGKDQVNGYMAHTRLERAMLDHMREIRGCLEAFGKEQVAREQLMSRNVTELARMKLIDNHHRDRIEMEAGANDLSVKSTTELEAMIRAAEEVTPSSMDVLDNGH